jgi:RES domain-containing protein
MVARRYRAEIDSDAGALLVGGRYNPAGEFGALYLAESQEACRAEVTRRIEPDAAMSLGELEVDLEVVCDLTDPTTLRALGVTHAALVGADWSVTQAIGRALRDAGFEGLVAPSAAGSYTILVLFKDRHHPPSSIRVVSITDL